MHHTPYHKQKRFGATHPLPTGRTEYLFALSRTPNKYIFDFVGQLENLQRTLQNRYRSAA
jgi:hypothetical protein